MRFLFIITLLLGLLNQSAALAFDCCSQSDEKTHHAQVDNNTDSSACHSESSIKDQHNPESQCDCPMGINSNSEVTSFPLVHFEPAQRYSSQHSRSIIIGHRQRLLRPPINT